MSRPCSGGCGTRVARPGYCPACQREYDVIQRARRKERREARKKAGICLDCPARATHGVRCEACALGNVTRHQRRAETRDRIASRFGAEIDVGARVVSSWLVERGAVRAA